MTGFEAKIREASKELTAKERVKFKDTTNAIQLDEATKENPLVIAPDFYVILNIHNERSEDKDYVKYIIVDKSGKKFVTGSESFFTAFKSSSCCSLGDLSNTFITISRYLPKVK